MKVFFTFFLAFALLAPGLSKLSYLVYFHINQQAIIAAHCVNKDKPEMKCDGKCHLKSQMTLLEEEKTEAPAPIPSTFLQIELTVFINLLETLNCNISNKASKTVFSMESFAFQAVVHEIFSPPKSAL